MDGRVTQSGERGNRLCYTSGLATSSSRGASDIVLLGSQGPENYKEYMQSMKEKKVKFKKIMRERDRKEMKAQMEVWDQKGGFY